MFTQSEIEWTTAATDALLGLVCVVFAIQLRATPAQAFWKRRAWIGLLVLLACG
jgi:hypothetical protein